MTALSDSQKREVIRELRNNPKSISWICTKYSISRATAYRLRAVALSGPESATFRLPGWPSKITSEQRPVLYKAIRARQVEIQNVWDQSRTNKEGKLYSGRPKSAKPALSLAETRAIAGQLGCQFSDSILRRLLAKLHIVTARQRLYRNAIKRRNK